MSDDSPTRRISQIFGSLSCLSDLQRQQEPLINKSTQGSSIGDSSHSHYESSNASTTSNTSSSSAAAAAAGASAASLPYLPGSPNLSTTSSARGIVVASRSTPNSPRLMPKRQRPPPAIPQRPTAAHIANPALLSMDDLSGGHVSMNVPQQPTASWPHFSALTEHLDVRQMNNYAQVMPEINWQERCLELQLELHRSKNQSGRIRDMLRDKVDALSVPILGGSSSKASANANARASGDCDTCDEDSVASALANAYAEGDSSKGGADANARAHSSTSGDLHGRTNGLALANANANARGSGNSKADAQANANTVVTTGSDGHYVRPRVINVQRANAHADASASNSKADAQANANTALRPRVINGQLANAHADASASTREHILDPTCGCKSCRHSVTVDRTVVTDANARAHSYTSGNLHGGSGNADALALANANARGAGNSRADAQAKANTVVSSGSDGHYVRPSVINVQRTNAQADASASASTREHVYSPTCGCKTCRHSVTVGRTVVTDAKAEASASTSTSSREHIIGTRKVALDATADARASARSSSHEHVYDPVCGCKSCHSITVERSAASAQASAITSTREHHGSACGCDTCPPSVIVKRRVVVDGNAEARSSASTNVRSCDDVVVHPRKCVAVHDDCGCNKCGQTHAAPIGLAGSGSLGLGSLLGGKKSASAVSASKTGGGAAVGVSKGAGSLLGFAGSGSILVKKGLSGSGSLGLGLGL